ncbi:GspH/FimT family pseudopilin [Stutzerimonas marianensis]|uniref:Type II secretion system protein H n=1 Tax=Stutzerimonas marianensis TaxID=2929513 RepID=A0A9X1W2F7_9GAMM|nr:GspH/FimT family pseudopilin [Pseudomonas marianensis]
MNITKEQAFSLVELLYSLLLLSILLAVATPNLKLLIERNQEGALRDSLIAFLNEARSHAITLRRNVRLCGSSDGLTCDGDWQRYWLMITTDNDQTIQLHHLSDTADLCWRGARDSIEFHPNGTTLLGNGRFSLCRSDGVAWQLVLSRQGRLRFAGDEGAGCCPTGDTTS